MLFIVLSLGPRPHVIKTVKMDNILLIILAVLLFGVWYSTRTFDYWKERKVVGRRPYPFIGTLTSQFLQSLSPSLAMRKLYNEFPNDKLIGGFMSTQPILIVKDPEIIKQVLVKDFDTFVDRGISTNHKREPLTQHLFLSSGDTWRTLRHKLTPTFTSGKMRKMFPLMVECGEEFENYIETIVEQGKTPEIKDLLAKYTTEVIGSCAFGIKTNSITDENAIFRRMGSKIFEPSLKRTIKLIIRTLFPQLHNLLGLKKLDQDVESFFLNLVHTIMSSRDNKPSTRHDFVDMLMELKTKGYIQNDSFKSDERIENIEMTDDLLSAQAYVFFIAGFETSSTTMGFALHELAFHEDIQKKAAEEIKWVLSKFEGKITYDALKEMKYLQMIIDETLRKYPPIGVLTRLCLKPCQITGTGVKIDKGVLVQIPVYALHHDPKYFPNPEQFIPKRFDSNSKNSINPYTYLPFGEGPRVCIGLRFARLQTMVGIIAILRNYCVVPKQSTKRDIKFLPNTFILCSEVGINLDFERRY